MKRLVRRFDYLLLKPLAQQLLRLKYGSVAAMACRGSFIRPTLVCMFVNKLMSELLTATINPAIATGRLEDLREEREGSEDSDSD